jgi:hypothetical protein
MFAAEITTFSSAILRRWSLQRTYLTYQDILTKIACSGDCTLEESIQIVLHPNRRFLSICLDRLNMFAAEITTFSSAILRRRARRIGLSTDLVTYDEAPDSKSKLRARHSWPCPVANDEEYSLPVCSHPNRRFLSICLDRLNMFAAEITTFSRKCRDLCSEHI